MTDAERSIPLGGRISAWLLLAAGLLGQAESRRGRRPEAVAAFERAVALKPRHRHVAALLARERAALPSPPTPPAGLP